MKDRKQDKTHEDKRETLVLMHQKTEQERNIIQNNCLAHRFCHPSSKPTVCKVRIQAMRRNNPKQNKRIPHKPYPKT